MDNKSKKIVLKYLLSKEIKIDGDRIYTDNLDFIKSDIIGVFGNFPLYELGFRELVSKFEGKVFRQIFDNKGRITKLVGPGFQCWEKKFNENGDCIYLKTKHIEWEKEFDDNHNCIFFKDIARKIWKTYDKDGKIIKVIME